MEELYLTVYSELVSVAPMSIITSKTVIQIPGDQSCAL